MDFSMEDKRIAFFIMQEKYVCIYYIPLYWYIYVNSQRRTCMYVSYKKTIMLVKKNTRKLCIHFNIYPRYNNKSMVRTC